MEGSEKFFTHSIFLDMGLDALEDGKTEEALELFRAASRTCPEHLSREVSRILYYTGLALQKLGSVGRAVRSWISAERYHHFPFIAEMLEKYTNDYGMVRQSTPELDDWVAFYSIQLKRYMALKPSGKIGTFAEQDMVRELILDAWQTICESNELELMGTIEKLEYFQSYSIIFPTTTMLYQDLLPQSLRRSGCYYQNYTAPCSCGSGLPNYLCCGRTPSPEELLSGAE
ncbi:MAG: tetratricopeptide repeat protein [Spirochaetales bacterium]|nr:tetratricopeptide repeat protein [Spirochaetales bacterium]MCF7937306.1 tetratricopeptide repeat protein [Spirochaetales bacterium]